MFQVARMLLNGHGPGVAALVMLPALFSTVAMAAMAGETGGAGERRAAADNDVLEEVVVRARKRGTLETVQETPIAMSAYNNFQYEQAFAETLTDLGRLAPNVDLRSPGSVRNVQNFMIRGMGLAGSTPSDDPAVGIIQDGVYWGVNYGGLVSTFDIESIEILRGPQGTLFGRNVTGGAVSVRSARPNGQFGARGSITAANDAHLDFQGHVEGPLSDRLAGRLAVKRVTGDGHLRNAETGSKFGERDTLVVRPIIKWEPNERTDITLIYQHYSDEGDSARTFAQADPSKLSVQIFGFTKPRDFFSFRGSPKTDRQDDVEIDSLTLDANRDLGHGVVTLIANRRTVDSINTLDTGATQFDLFDTPLFHMDQDQFSTELRYASTVWDDFEFVTGVYYFEQDYVYRQTRDVLLAFPVGTPGRSQIAFESQLDHDSIALFGEAEYYFTDRWSLAAGLRWTEESKDGAVAPWGECTLDFTSCTYQASGDDSWTNVTPSLTLSFTPNDKLMGYASFDRGFRSGGFSLRGTPFIGPYDEEIVDAFEVGLKSNLAGGRLQVNFAGYYNSYDDLQRTVLREEPGFVGFIQSTFNAAEATIRGIELDVRAQPWSGATLNVAYGYTDAGYDKFEGLDVDGDDLPDPQMAEDLDFLRVPENTVAVVGTQEFPVSDLGSLLLRVQYNYTDSQFFDDANTFFQNSYEEVDASITFNSPGGKWSVSAFGKNLFEEEYYIWGAHVGPISKVGASVRPRTYGIRVTGRM